MPRQTSARVTLTIAVSLLCAVLAIHIFIYSPWHRHDPMSRQMCSFAQFEQGSALKSSTHIAVEAPAVAVRIELGERTLSPLDSYGAQVCGRAPPA